MGLVWVRLSGAPLGAMSFGCNPPQAVRLHTAAERSCRDEVEAIGEEAPGSCLLVGRGGRSLRVRNRAAPKEVLLVAGIASTALMGGGLIFGFAPFANKLTKLPGSPFTTQTVSSVFSIGHNITAWGCILSGMILDRFGPRICVMSGLLIEALGHFLMMNITRLPSKWFAYIGFGLLGLGGCQVLLAALTFADAFRNAGLATAVITAAFQAAGFVFMLLPIVDWETFFLFYTVACLAGAFILGFLYPRVRLPPFAENEGASDMDAMTSAIAGSRTLLSILLRPGTIGFLSTFMIAGSALTYGLAEFTPAVRDKDACSWDPVVHDFVDCERQGFQDQLNNILMPLVSNFIVPCSLALGLLVDKTGFPLAAFINVFFVQAFMLTLWLLPLDRQYATLIVCNVANSAVWTIQNTYICAVGHDHIGALFGISNLVLGVGNLAADWMSLNPFGTERKAIHQSIEFSAIAWLVACCPLYAWPLVEAYGVWKRRLAAEGRLPTSPTSFRPQTSPGAGSPGGAREDGAPSPSRRGNSASPSRRGQGSVEDKFKPGGGESGPASALGLRSSFEQGPAVQVQGCGLSHLAEPLSAACPMSVTLVDEPGDAIRGMHHPVVTVNPQLWEQKVRKLLKAGREGVFFVLDFDRTVTRCFMEDGSRASDCHDILASIPKITRDCKQTMEDLMERYYPIEIDAHMTREQKIPHMVEWYRLVNELLASQGLTQADVEKAVRHCKEFRLRSGSEEVFQIAHRLDIPVIVISAGLGNVIEEVLRQCVRKPDGTTGTPWPNVHVLSNTLLWDEAGSFAAFSEPLIHMFNKSLEDAPDEIHDMLEGRHTGVLCGDGPGDLTMADGHDLDCVLKFGFLNERVEERLFRYIGNELWDKVVLSDGSFEPLLEVLRQL